MFRKNISRLKKDIVTANSLVQEANYLAEEMGKQVKYSVTLQIPPANLSPNRKVKYWFFVCVSVCLMGWRVLTCSNFTETYLRK